MDDGKIQDALNSLRTTIALHKHGEEKLQLAEEQYKEADIKIRKDFLTKFIKNKVVPIITDTVHNMFTYAEVMVEKMYPEKTTAMERYDDILKMITEEFNIKDIDNASYKVSLYSPNNVSDKYCIAFEDKDDYTFITIPLDINPMGIVLEAKTTNEDYLYWENSYDRFVEGRNITELTNNIKQTAIMYHEKIEEMIIQKATNENNRLKEEMNSFEKKVNYLTGGDKELPSIISLCDMLGIERNGDVSKNGIYARLYEDNLYIIATLKGGFEVLDENYQEKYMVLSETDIYKAMEGLTNQDKLFALENAEIDINRDYEDLLFDAFQGENSPYVELNSELQDVCSGADYADWADAINEWVTLHPLEILGDEKEPIKKALDFYTPLCNWLQSERMSPVIYASDKYMELNFAKADENMITAIEQYKEDKEQNKEEDKEEIER